MKLIDLLNMAEKGELKEKTKVIYKETEFEYWRLELEDGVGCSIMHYVNDMLDLSDECELIEPDHFADIGKMAEKIKELDKDSCGVINEYNSQGEVYARSFNVGAFRNEIIDKLNEVIRRINNVR